MTATPEAHMGSEPQVVDAESHPNIRAGSAEEIVARALLPGEQVVTFTECLRKVALALFEKTSITITDRRLLVIGPAFPWGQELKSTHELSACQIVNGKERVDGSRLLVVRHESGTICLYFPRSHQDDADAVLGAVRLSPGPLVVPAEAQSSPRVDQFAIAMELAALSDDPEDSD